MKRLTKKQENLKLLLDKKGMTFKEASIELKVSLKSVQKMFSRIREKEVEGLPPFSKKWGVGVTPIGHPPFLKKIRLHNIQFHILLSFVSERYHNRRLKGDSFKFDNNSIVLNRKSFEIYCLNDFFGENSDVCLRLAHSYFFDELFPKLESKLGVVFVKEGSSGVRMVRSHYAEVGNELAEDVNIRGEKLDFKGEDGKTWLLVDKSLKNSELEAVHPEFSKVDIDKIQPFFIDLRNNPVLLSEILGLLKVQQLANNDTAQGLQAVVNVLKVLFPDRKESVDSKQTSLRADYFG